MQLALDLVQALAADVEARDEEQKQALRRLQQRLTHLQGESRERWAGLQRDVGGLYALFTTQFSPRDKGE